jgi:acetyl/propionyl-CoA carboxylase alpha subunit
VTTTFEIDVNGRTRSVTVERASDNPSRFHLTIDGEVMEVDAVRTGGDALSLILPSHESFEVGLAPGLAAGDWTVYLHQGMLDVSVNGRRSRRTGAATAAGDQRIVAPMPGKVLRVLVKPGDEVAARQPLVVVEAMKMENELAAPRGGRVKDVAAVVGQLVEAGRLLVVVE